MTRDPTYAELAERLLELEALLRNRRLWSREHPGEQALASDQPFACDTLSFPEWLQFIFIPRLHQVAEHRAPLPEKCDVAPMAEEYFRSRAMEAETVVRQLRDLDVLITEN